MNLRSPRDRAYLDLAVVQYLRDNSTKAAPLDIHPIRLAILAEFGECVVSDVALRRSIARAVAAGQAVKIGAGPATRYYSPLPKRRIKKTRRAG